LMLRHSLGHEAAAASIEAAIGRVFADGLRTVDLVPPGAPALGCAAMAKAIVERLS